LNTDKEYEIKKLMEQHILIVGLGGVGGYFGGMLARKYENTDIHINFLARGNHLEEINQHGLKLLLEKGSFTAKPYKASNEAENFTKMDYIFLCTKSYDLEDTMALLGPCVSADTVFIPLQNGVDSKERINRYYPNNLVVDGCAYIVSRLKAAGVIEVTGKWGTMSFGLNGEHDERLDRLYHLVQQADINVNYSDEIEKIIWDKFIFISAMATATSYFDCSIGQIMEDPKKKDAVIKLIQEVATLAQEKGVVIADHIVHMTLDKMEQMPYDATSSMHTDYLNKRPQTELASLTAYVIRESKKYNLEAPEYQRMFDVLRLKSD
jgi:2-dehydropantoate 2-reductase